MLELAEVKYSLLNGIKFTLTPGRVLAVLGPSGCGKTTLLKITMGVLAPEQGRVVWNESVLTEGGRIVVPAEDRNFGVVFQDGALFPHLSVAGNIAFGLHRHPVDVQRKRVEKLMDEMGLHQLRKRRVHTLSGGERQRVALARAIAREPQMLLLDEPFSSVDRLARQDLIEIVSKTLRSRGMSAILVTHDARDANDLADDVLLLRDGKMIRHGSLPAVFSDPGSEWAQRFLRCGLGSNSAASWEAKHEN